MTYVLKAHEQLIGTPEGVVHVTASGERSIVSIPCMASLYCKEDLARIGAERFYRTDYPGAGLGWPWAK